MSSDGKFLEDFIRKVEESLAGHSVKVENNVRKFDETGTQIAEFDVVLSGRVGSTDLRVLIECRDRPSSGPAPAQWIEQMIGRRQVHHFSHVIAVSTTGFAPGARQAAQVHNIELREVTRLDPQELGELFFGGIIFKYRQQNITSLNFAVSYQPNTPTSTAAAATAIIRKNPNGRIFQTPKGQENLTALEIWRKFSPELRGDVKDSDPEGPYTITVDMTKRNIRVWLQTPRGVAHVDSVTLTAYCVWHEETLVPSGVRYTRSSSGEPISEAIQYVSPSEAGGLKIEVRRDFDNESVTIIGPGLEGQPVETTSHWPADSGPQIP